MELLILWIIISISALLIDIVTSAFLFLWFTIGGIAAIIALIFNYSFTVQLIVFIAISAISMGIGYPAVRKYLGRSVTKTTTMEEGYINRVIIVDEDFIETAKVKIDGIYWTVKNYGEPIKRGDSVVITTIEGNKLIVKKQNLEKEIE
ncbi:NfeD family protein [Candidatus Clostridium radicumherbarum]|uniref:NfeD family protein n=1 Tax=Candidatus Clostridium radicumherbarum TaxID=3381662 RepID=A0ABW8TRX2_9CLOT